MKKLYLTALLVLPLLAAPANAEGFCFPFRIEARLSGYLRITCSNSCGACYGCPNPGCGGVQLGPWYNYWPLEAHFNSPAPTGYPYWPQPQALLPAYPGSPAPKLDGHASGPDVKPVGYFTYPNPYYAPSIQYGPAPSYWTPRP